jgi:hypothetical protein
MVDSQTPAVILSVAMNPFTILYPLAGMFLLYVLVAGWLVMVRALAVRQRQTTVDHFKTYQGAQTPAMIQAARNYANLFEAPVLFYVIVILIYGTETVDDTAVTLAWIFVACRYLHSAVHLTVNHVPTRFAFFLLSLVALAILWVRWFIAVLP